MSIIRYGWKQRIVAGVVVGLGVAGIQTAIATLVYIRTGSVDDRLTLFHAILFYGSSGLVVGALAGILAPLVKHWLIAILLGVLLTFPVAMTAAILTSGDASLTGDNFLVAVILATAVGGAGGFSAWYHATRYL